MLELIAQGDEHPKTFVLKTDDSDGELARLQEIMEEVDDSGDDPMTGWLAEHSADQFAEGVVIPMSEAPEFIELLENDWPDAYEVFDRERKDAYAKAEAAMADDD